MCVLEPRVTAKDPLVEQQLVNLERAGVLIITRLGLDPIVQAEYDFEDVIRKRIQTELALQGTTYVSDQTMISINMSKPILKASDLEAGRKSVSECKRIETFLIDNGVAVEDALSILDANFTSLYQEKYASNWDPESIDIAQLPKYTSQIMKALKRFVDKRMPCILMHQDIHLYNLAIQTNGNPALVDFGHSACINFQTDLETMKYSAIKSYDKSQIGNKLSPMQDSIDTLEIALDTYNSNPRGKLFPAGQYDRLYAFALVALQSESPMELAEKQRPIFLNRDWPVQFVAALSDKEALANMLHDLQSPRDTIQQLKTLEEEFGLDDEDPDMMRLINARKLLENSYAKQENAYNVLQRVFQDLTEGI